MKQKEPLAIVVGAGLGGVATALGLRLQGFKVQVWEKNETSGGKIQEYRENGYRWDLGPSLMTMPYVLQEWFIKADRNIEDYLELIPLSNTCRYIWQDGTLMDENEDFWKNSEIRSLLEHGEGVYLLSGKAYLEHPPSEFWKAFQWGNLKNLIHLPKLMSFKTLAELIDQKIRDPYLRQLFCRYATYNGSSPYKTPSTFSIIPYVEHKFGGWYIKGGMRQVAIAFENLAKELGVDFHFSQEVVRFEGGILESKQGMRQRPDVVICNGEVIQSAETWLKDYYKPSKIRSLREKELSSSGFIMLLGVKGENKTLSHHNVSFSKNYNQEFQEIFDEHKLPSDPTIYICVTKHATEEDAPVGCENWFVLVNTPAKTDFLPEQWDKYQEKIMMLLRGRGLLLESQTIEVKKILHAGDLARRDNTTEGALYGWASHSIRTSLFRPPMKVRGKSVYFVGGSTHPGGGIPMVLLSSKIICKKIFNDFS